MAAISLHKYKISISEESKHTQGLQVGDIVRRQYKDGNNIIYSLMCVTETGSESGREYFIGVLLDGDAPSTGQVLDFVRVTNLYNANRLGALYLTASDASAPYMDVIDGIAVEQSLCYPVSNNDYSYEDGFAQYVIQGKDHLKSTSYTQSGLGNIQRICDMTFKSSAVSSDSYVGISQDIDDNLKVGEIVLIGFHIKANRALTGAKLLFEYQDHSVSDAEIVIPRIPASDYAYMVFAVSVDNSAAYKRNMTIDFRNANIQEDDNISIANLNIIRLSSVANFKGGTKARVGKLNGIVDEVFGSLHDYGVYSQRFFASKAVNIAGTLTAGDENGSGATFYAGKIHKNVFIDSLNLSGCSGYTAISNESPTGLGKSVAGTALVFEAQSKAWADAHKGMAYTLSFYAKSSNADYITIYQGEDTLGGIRIEADDSWHRYSFTFNLMEYDSNDNLAFTLSAESSVTISSLQLETGKYTTQYQATDTTLSYSDEYGAWFCRGGVGGTIQNPLLRFGNDGSISSRGDLFHINADGTGYFVGGAFTWNTQGIQLRQLVLTWDQLDSSIKNRIESAGTEWVADWNKTATTIGENYIVTPKIFAGTVTNNKMTGVYLGQLSTTEAGIYGFDDGNRIFFIDKTGAEIGGWSITSVGLQSPTGRMHILSTGSIKAAYGDTTYWEIRENGSASFAQGNVLLNADGSASFTGSITAASGAIGGWNIGSDRLTSMNIAMNTTNRYIAVVNKTMITGEENDLNYLTSVRALGGVAMYYTSSADWGLIGYNSIGQTFSLGSTNKIGCWYFDDGALWSGTKVDTLASYAGTNNITIGGNGIRSQGWYLDKDGAVAFGHGTALFRANGSGYIANQNIVWGAGGDATLGGGTSGFNLDGSGWVADHAISWNANGDVTFSNAVRLSFQGMVTASVIDNVLGDSAVLAATTNSITAKIQEAANGNPNLLENAALLGFRHIGNFPVWGDEHGDYIPEGYDGNFEHDCGVGLGSWDYYGHRTAWYHGTAGLNTHLYTCEWMTQQVTDKLEPDTWYTFSFMLKGAATCSPLKTFVYPNACVEYTRDGEVGNSPGDVYCLWTATTEWTKHVVKFKTPQIIDKTYPIRLIFRIEPQDSAEFFVYVSQIKLEKGNESTAWNDGDTTKKLYDTGIDIQKRKIDITADTLTVRNNSGMQVFGSDANGNLDVTAAISALSLNVKDLDGHVRLRFAMNNEQNRTIFVNDVEQPLLYNNDYPADTPMLIILDTAGNVIYSVAMTGVRGYASFDTLKEYRSGFGTDIVNTTSIDLYYNRATTLQRMKRQYYRDYNFQYGYIGTLYDSVDTIVPDAVITTANSLHGVSRDVFYGEPLTQSVQSLYMCNTSTNYKPVKTQSASIYKSAVTNGVTSHSIYLNATHNDGECFVCWRTYEQYTKFISTFNLWVEERHNSFSVDSFYSYLQVQIPRGSDVGELNFEQILVNYLGNTYYEDYCDFLINDCYEPEAEMTDANYDRYRIEFLKDDVVVQYGDSYTPIYYTY